MKDVTQNPAPGQPPKLLDQLRRCIRDKHFSLRTERVYVYWARWYIRFHGLRHPMKMGAPEIQTFLSYLANERNVSVSTHHQALCALLFFYKNVLQIELAWLDNVHRPAKPVRRPTVLTRQELARVFAQMTFRNGIKNPNVGFRGLSHCYDRLVLAGKRPTELGACLSKAILQSALRSPKRRPPRSPSIAPYFQVWYGPKVVVLPLDSSSSGKSALPWFCAWNVSRTLLSPNRSTPPKIPRFERIVVSRGAENR